jgi:hypothetical protein
VPEEDSQIEFRDLIYHRYFLASQTNTNTDNNSLSGRSRTMAETKQTGISGLILFRISNKDER